MDGAMEAARVVLLDRDGTVVIDRDYLDDPAGLEFLPGAAEGLRRLHQRGHRLVIVSNQSGVGRGLFTQQRLDAMNQRLREMVREAGAELAGIYCCPHRPDDACACRKPNIGLVQQAARELHFDPADSIVIGDRDSDIELGQRIGAVTIRLSPQVEAGSSGASAAASLAAPAADYVVEDLLQAAGIIEAFAPAVP
jgi:D-glycero-D-manno-heptose 1,7-bisphosphate phosphatase